MGGVKARVMRKQARMEREGEMKREPGKVRERERKFRQLLRVKRCRRKEKSNKQNPILINLVMKSNIKGK